MVAMLTHGQLSIIVICHYNVIVSIAASILGLILAAFPAKAEQLWIGPSDLETSAPGIWIQIFHCGIHKRQVKKKNFWGT